jgi:hypothetical protein
MAAYPAPFGPTQPVLVDDGPLPVPPGAASGSTPNWAIEITFNEDLKTGLSPNKNNFSVVVDGSPSTISSVTISISKGLQIMMNSMYPTTSLTIEQTTIDSEVQRDSDSYVVFPWGPILGTF